MAATPSTMLPLGTQAPDFTLFDSMSGGPRSLDELKGEQGTLIIFMCNHCPYVLHIKDQLVAIANEYAAKGINTIGISANDVESYPQDGPDKMTELMAEWGNPFSAYLYDESQEIAQAYQAACTPDIYLFDAELKCVYRGRLDGATPKNDVPLTGEDLRQALDAMVAGEPVSETQLPSIGCNIKWKS